MTEKGVCMKVLQVNCVYKKGSTGKIVHDIHTELKASGIESVVCYGRGAKIKERGVYKTCGEFYSKFNNLLSRITGIMYGGCLFSTNKLIRIIKKEKPDVVHLHCLNGYFVNIYRLVTWLKESGIKTVLTLHAEFMHTANCGHAFDCEKWKTGCGKCPVFKKETQSILFDRTATSWRRMKKAFDGFENLVITSVSPWLMERAKLSPILADKKHVVVMNGLDTDVFYPRDVKSLRENHGITNEKIVFHATPSFSDSMNHIKGGYYVLELARLLEKENVKFFIAGPYEISGNIPENVVLLGRIADQNKLAEYYSMADVTVIASKRETFSMICAESLCCGTPIVGFKAGAPEMISIPEFSNFVEYGNLKALCSSIEKMLKLQISFASILEEARMEYSKIGMVNRYLDIYNK